LEKHSNLSPLVHGPPGLNIKHRLIGGGFLILLSIIMS